MKTFLRKNFLLVLLLIFIVPYVYIKEFSSDDTGNHLNSSHDTKVEVLDFKNEFNINEVVNGDRTVKLKISYAYNGEFGKYVLAVIRPLFTNEEDIERTEMMAFYLHMKLGKHEQEYDVANPCDPRMECPASGINVKIVNSDYLVKKSKGIKIEDVTVFLEKTFDYQIAFKPLENGDNKNTSELNDVIRILDTTTSKILLRSAKNSLDKLLIEQPENMQIYHELARYHMVSNQGEVGLRSAEEVLNEAESLNNNFVNTYVLRGYVYTQQGKYDLAEKDFKRAKEIGTDSWWLNTYIGKLFEKQGETDKALEYYKTVIDLKSEYRSRKDRAKKASYTWSLEIYKQRQDYQSVDALYANMVKQFPYDGCLFTDYGYFKLHDVGDFKAALNLSKKGIIKECIKKRHARTTHSDALIYDWFVRKNSNGNGASQFAQAISLDGDWPRKLYRLSQSKRFHKVIRALTNEKVDINELNKRGNTALTIAVVENNVDAIKTLLRFNADPNVEFDQGYTIFLRALLTSKKETIEALLESKIPLKTKFSRGITAESLLKERGFDDLVARLNLRT